jgi:hypothetical protein
MSQAMRELRQLALLPLLGGGYCSPEAALGSTAAGAYREEAPSPLFFVPGTLPDVSDAKQQQQQGPAYTASGGDLADLLSRLGMEPGTSMPRLRFLDPGFFSSLDPARSGTDSNPRGALLLHGLRVSRLWG